MGSPNAKHLASCFVAASMGAALGWAAHSMLGPDQGEASRRYAELTTLPIQPKIERPEASALPQATSRIVHSDTPQVEPEPSSVDRPSNSPEGSTFVLAPDRSSDVLAMPSLAREPSTAEDSIDPLADLLNAMTIWCRFAPGNGAHLQDEGISMYELNYQGGPISYESISVESGTARMIGSAGATGSPEGVLEVLVTATHSGLHFSAFNSTGELVVTTVFGAIDELGRHSAVMTTHGAHPFNGSYQAYGTCDGGTLESRRIAG